MKGGKCFSGEVVPTVQATVSIAPRAGHRGPANDST